MTTEILDSKTELGKMAAMNGAHLIREAIRKNGFANIIVATGASQFEMLDFLVKQNVDWSKVTAFHLDEYIGLTENHPASFRKYLKERFVSKISLQDFIYVNGDINPQEECRRLETKIVKHPIDVAFIGIGENGHLAFNDPPADFDTKEPYIVVDLDEACRRQQLGEGWFRGLEDVPAQAISMSIKQMMKAQVIICTVPDRRKAQAVHDCFTGEVTPLHPASLLRQHDQAFVFLDADSASLLDRDQTTRTS